jgi:integrase
MGRHRKRHHIPTQFIAGFPVREVRPGYYLVDFQIQGRRVRKAYSDLAAATTYCEAKRREITNKGTQALELTDAMRADAVQALAILKDTGGDLVEAAQEYARRHPKTQGETVRQTCDRYLADMVQQGRRPLAIKDKGIKFNALCTAMGDRQTVTVDRLDIDGWVAAAGYRNGTAHAYAGAALTLLRFFGGEKRQRRHTDEAVPVTWNVKTVADLFAKAEQHTPDLVPALAVLFFAGLRPHEMLRLTWEQIDMGTRVIRLTGEQTKTRAMRNVEIAKNLLAWLKTHCGSGPVIASLATYRSQREILMEKCGLKTWPTDVARHTFATAHYNAHQDAAKTMAQLGHFGSPQMFLTHYKGVPMSAKDAAAYWKIMPAQKAVARKVVPFAAAAAV